MSDQTHEPTPELQPHSGTISLEQGRSVGPNIPNGQTLGAQECPHCGAENHAAATVCHACGEHLRQRPKNIRCRQCGQTASSSLTICPHCGRELYAAPSRIWTWLVPAILGLLLLIFFMSRLQGGPFAWAQSQVDRSTAWLSGIGEDMAPDVLVEMTPVADALVVDAATEQMTQTVDAEAAVAVSDDAGNGDAGTIEGNSTDGNSIEGDTAVALASTATPMPEPTETPVPPTETPAETPTDEPTEQPTEAPSETPTSEPTATQEPTLEPTATARATATQKPTNTPSPTETVAETEDEVEAQDEATSESAESEAAVILQPTPTSDSPATAASVALIPTNTPTPASREYTIQAGDTLLSIAARFAVTVDALMAANDITPGDAYTLRVGEVLAIPASDGQGGPATQTYTVRTGDTFLAIANRFDLSIAELQAANGLTDEEVRLLRPGQELTIPVSGGTSTISSNPQPTPTPTVEPTATATPAPTEPSLRLDTPQLSSPEDGTFVSCSGGNQLAWSGVNFILPADEYVLHLGFVNGVDANGNESIIWVLNQARPSNRTSWEMDNDLCGLAPQAYGRQWRWYVEVVDEAGESVSLPSETWGFSWN